MPKAQSSSQASMVDLNNTKVAYSALSDYQLKQAWLLFRIIGQPLVVKLGPSLADLSLKLHLPVQGLIKKTIFSHFCGGETIQACLPRIQQLSAHKIGTILDFAREGGGQEADFDLVEAEIISTIDLAAQHRDAVPFAVFKPTGIASLDLLSKKDRHQDLTAAESAAFQRVRQRFESICAHAALRQVRIMIDAEESWIQQTVDSLATELMERFNGERAIVFNTVQFYRHDRLAFLKNALDRAQTKNYHLGIKLVRGAYMEKERKFALEQGLPSPINPDKAASDAAFDAGLRLCVEHINRVAICAGTHNEASVTLLMQLMREAKLSPQDDRLHFAQLLGMSDHISFNLAAAGYHVAKYMPYGTVAELLPYLTRRAQENSSVLGQSSRELDFLSSEMHRRKRTAKPK